MCGIAGELRFDAVPSDADWEALGALMARRGPDDAGLWQDPYCTLVFRRLAILDLSPAGHQPMTTPDGRHTLVFNGEVYNFREIRRDLEAHGVRFRSHGDSEVVLQALARWGLDALGRFNGMFALGCYDHAERRLLLARDHAGIKPLYWMRSARGIVFASQYDQLLGHPWSRSLPVSPEAAGLYLRFAYIPAPWALLADTHMLEPGGWLRVDAAGRIEQGRFYSFPRWEAPTLRGDDAVDAVDAAITAAVRRQLVSDVPVGAFLSGGIDSPVVVAKMRAAVTGSMRAFSIGTAGDVTDESEDASAYARELSVEHTLEQVTPDGALAMLDDVVAAAGEPFGDYSIFPTMLVSRLASRSFKVMLSGDGGDELFWGYVGRSGRAVAAANEFGQPPWLRQVRHTLRRALRRSGQAHLRHASIGDWYRAMHTHLPEEWLQRIFPELPPLPVTFDAFTFADTDPDRTAQWTRWSEFVFHLPGVLLKVDRASMHHSLEVRVPLLDREVIDVASQVDWRSCLDLERQRGKLPLRTVLARHVRHQSHGKRGFAPPMGAWLRTSLREVFEAAVLGRDELLGVRIDRASMKALFSEHLAGRRDYGWGLWPLLSAALWVGRHRGARAAPRLAAGAARAR